MNKKKFLKSRNSSLPRTVLSPASADVTLTEKRIKTELKEAFLSLSEEEMFKYFEIFRKSFPEQ